jgi:hypothetical protein
MRPSEKRLIQRLKERNSDRERATDGGIHSRKSIPPVAAKALQAAERAIGFKLPELLRAIYLSVGNGGLQSVAHGAAEPADLTKQHRFPRQAAPAA